jgi:uncharacterized membrane protein YccC
LEADVKEAWEPAKKRGPGRPKGSRNTPPVHQQRIDTSPQEAFTDYRRADLDTMVARQLAMLDWAQCAARNELMAGYNEKGVRVADKELERLLTLSNALVRTIEALKKSADLADEIASRLTAEQLLEAAIAKLEGQSPATIRYALRRLNNVLKHVDRNTNSLPPAADTATASIKSLEAE